jgi:hypothetical protein
VFPQPNAPRPAELLADLLDAGYTNAVGPVIEAIARDTTTGPLAQSLANFRARAEELAMQGETLSADDPALRLLLADFGDSLRRGATAINAVGGGVGELGIDAAGQFFRQMTLMGLDDDGLARIGVSWNQPDPAAINAAVNWTAGAAWQNELAIYGDIADDVRTLALRGIVAGRGPLSIAQDITAAVETLPQFQANNLMRTLQVQSYRVGSAVYQDANRDILSYQIRLSAADGRTCLCCFALHGTKLPVGEIIRDHHQGRCFGITQLKGYEQDLTMTWDDGGTVIRYQTGEELWSKLPEATRREIAGPGAFEALRSGEMRLADFVQRYDDPLFGQMVREASLRSIRNNPNRQVPTPNGWRRADVGRPGTTTESLNTFLGGSAGPLAEMFLNPEMGLVEQDWSTDLYSVIPANVRNAAKAFVVESRDIQLSRDYLLTLVADAARINGVDLTPTGAEQMLNAQYRARAQAILAAAEIGNVRLTEPQTRRLRLAVDGNFLDMVYAEGDEGSLERGTRRARSSSGGGSSNMTPAARLEARENFLRITGRMDD